MSHTPDPHPKPDPDAGKVSAVEARQGIELHRMRWVLIVSFLVAVVALVIVYLVVL